MSMYITGIASGLDTDAWIEAILAVERRPIAQMQQRKSTLQQERDAWRDINTRLNNLSSRLSDLRLSITFTSRTASSSDATVATASAGTAASPGVFRLEVIQLAQAHRVASDQFALEDQLGLSGTFKITVGDKSAEITVGEDDTLATIAKKINEADAGVTARIIDQRLVLQATDLGESIEFEDSAVDESGVLTQLGILKVDAENPGEKFVKHELQAAQDAVFKVDGLEITRKTNTVSDVIEGVTLTLLKAGETSVAIRHDINRVVDRVKAFVEQYNSVQTFIKDKTGKGQVLQGDVLLQRIQAQLRHQTSAPIAGDTAYNQLAQIGITIDKSGTMTLDENKLRAAVNEDPDAVQRLFAASAAKDGFDGVAVRLGNQLEQWLRSGGGLLVSRQQMLDDRMRDIDRSIERMETRLEMRETTLRRQFVRLEEVLGGYQTTATWLEAQLQQLNSFASYQARRR